MVQAGMGATPYPTPPGFPPGAATPQNALAGGATGLPTDHSMPVNSLMAVKGTSIAEQIAAVKQQQQQQQNAALLSHHLQQQQQQQQHHHQQQQQQQQQLQQQQQSHVTAQTSPNKSQTGQNGGLLATQLSSTSIVPTSGSSTVSLANGTTNVTETNANDQVKILSQFPRNRFESKT